MALRRLHLAKHLPYGDLSLQNMVLDQMGYLSTHNFDLAGETCFDKAPNVPLDYLAPEFVSGEKLDLPIDWWALGILTYELVVGVPPSYTGARDRASNYEATMNSEVYFPDSMSDNCKDFISKLLSK